MREWIPLLAPWPFIAFFYLNQNKRRHSWIGSSGCCCRNATNLTLDPDLMVRRIQYCSVFARRRRMGLTYCCRRVVLANFPMDRGSS